MFNQDLKDMFDCEVKNVEVTLSCYKCDKEMIYADEMHDYDDNFCYEKVIYYCPNCENEISFDLKGKA